ncbi:MAG: hypothetical protein ACC700_11280 [Anaerolineales bacterium]
MPEASAAEQEQAYRFSIAWRAPANRWLWLVAGFALGSIFGLLFSFAFPAQYQATASLAVNIDYGLAAPLELIVEDRALDRVYQLTTSDATLGAVIEELGSSQGPTAAWASIPALRQQVRLDQRLARWDLIGFSDDPVTAAAIANSWADIALARLEQAREHSRTAAQMQGTPYLVECIGLLPPATSKETLWQCVASGPDIDPDAVEALNREIEAGHGILPNLAFELVQSAQPPSGPALWGRGALVFAGGILGLLGAASAAIMLGPREDPA